MTIHLQGIGERNALPARDLIAGDVMICNFGETQTIVAVTPSESGKSVFVDIKSNSGCAVSKVPLWGLTVWWRCSV